MDLTSQTSSPVVCENAETQPAYVSMVDPFLVEALQSPRHRLTILRMELDVQKFLQNPDAQQFEFPHFPTSYIRLAAHRVALHYGLHTMNQEIGVGGQEIRILVTKKPESKFPAVCLSDVPAKESENGKNGPVKFVIRPRPKASSGGGNELGNKRNSVRTVEERKEEYDRARARIFGSPNGYETDESLTRVSSVERIVSIDASEISRNLGLDEDRSLYNRDIGNSSRGVAIFRDREKDRTDPDYDRSYDRYVRNMPSIQNFSLPPYSMQKFQHPAFVQYDSVFPQQVQMAAPPQASVDYMNPVMTTPYCAMGLNQSSGNAVYMQWPTQSMIYAQSYDQLRHGFIQAPFSQQPLSFDYSQSR